MTAIKKAEAAKSSAAPATKFEKLKELAEKATQSKWEHDGLAIESGRGTIARCPTPQNEGVFDCHQNAEYIAAANPKAILEILAAHQALYEALSAAHFFLSHTGNHRALVGDNFRRPSIRFDTLTETTEKCRAALALADAAKEGEAKNG